MAQSRVQRSESEWSSILEQWRSSGLSAAQFASQRGVGQSSLHKWARRMPVVAPGEFNEVHVAEAPTEASSADSGVLEIMTRNGYVIRVGHGVNAEALGAVLKAVAIC